MTGLTEACRYQHKLPGLQKHVDININDRANKHVDININDRANRSMSISTFPFREHLSSPLVFMWGPCHSSFRLSVFFLCCFFFVFYFIFVFICALCPYLQIALDCPFVIVPSVFSNVYYLISYDQCKQNTFN